jgi:hypothetical protein
MPINAYPCLSHTPLKKQAGDGGAASSRGCCCRRLCRIDSKPTTSSHTQGQLLKRPILPHLQLSLNGSHSPTTTVSTLIQVALSLPALPLPHILTPLVPHPTLTHPHTRQNVLRHIIFPTRPHLQVKVRGTHITTCRRQHTTGGNDSSNKNRQCKEQ